MSDTLWQSSVRAAVAQSQLLSVWVAVGARDRGSARGRDVPGSLSIPLA